LVTPDVGAAPRIRLQSVGSRLVEVSDIAWPHIPAGVIDSYRSVFAKLHTWNLTSFRQVALIDTDVFLTRSAADGLFDLCSNTSAELCAGREPQNKALNVGIMVIRPSPTGLRRLLQGLATFEHPVARLPEQSFLNHFYDARGWTQERPNGLEFFNGQYVLVDGRWVWRAVHNFQTCPAYARRAFLYASVMRQTIRRRIEEFALWHACGIHKLERLPRCPPERVEPSSNPNASSFCTSRVLRLFQWLQLVANPCSAHGSAERTCDAVAGCRWCSEQVRCIPRSWDCFLGDSFTAALGTRMTQPRGMSTVRPGWCSTTCDQECCARRKSWIPTRTTAG